MSEREQAPYGSGGWPLDPSRHPGAPGDPRHRDTMPGTVARHADQDRDPGYAGQHGDQHYTDERDGAEYYGGQHDDSQPYTAQAYTAQAYTNPYDDDQPPPGPHFTEPYEDRHDRHDEGHYAAGQHEPEYPPYLVAVRSPDLVAGFLLIFAGMVTGVSLLLPWARDSALTEWDLLRRGIEEAGAGAGALFSSVFWPPVVVVAGGTGLLLLGLLLVVPARTHRFLGAVALLVSLAVAAGVLVPLSEGGWDLSLPEIGFWFSVAVAVLGLLGALKALASGPKHRPPGVR